MPAELRAAAIGGVFARAADRHLQQRRGNRRNDHREQRANHTRAFAIARAAAEEHAEVRQHRDGAGDGGRYRHGERVAVLPHA